MCYLVVQLNENIYNLLYNPTFFYFDLKNPICYATGDLKAARKGWD